MKAPRFFDNQTLTVCETIQLSTATSHRLTSVLRLSVDDPLMLFNGDGYEYKGIITHIKRNGVTVKILERTLNCVESPLKIHLGQAVSKGEKMDFVMQKATELGVCVVSPVCAMRSVVHLKAERLEKKQEHWQKIAMHAAEQSGRGYIPVVQPTLPLMEWLETRTENTRLVLDPMAQQTLSNIEIQGPVALLIGPEGGLTEAEINHAKQRQFKPIKLGPRILRTETAALAILALIQYAAGDFQR